MAKSAIKKGARGPYKTGNVVDPDKLGTGGIRLRQHRMARLWTVERMAEEAGVSEGTISGIEGGSLGWSPRTLTKLAGALGVTVGALFDVDPRKGAAFTIWPLWQAADGSQRQRILDHAEGVVGRKK